MNLIAIADRAATLVLGGLVGWVIGKLLSRLGQPARERKQDERQKIVVIRALEEDWQKRHPGEPITVPVHEQIFASATAAIEHITAVATLYEPKVWGSAVGKVTPPDGEKGGGGAKG